MDHDLDTDTEDIKHMCDTCKHRIYCHSAYKKDHWCGNHEEQKNFISSCVNMEELLHEILL